MHKLRFRQVHLDFHTSSAIESIGVGFEKKQWQEAIKIGGVDSITCFSKCHHGWSYHPTKVGKQHPNLKFDLLHAQYDACKEIDVNISLYLSAGVDNVASADHPEWREIGNDGKYLGWAREETEAGFHTMCFNSPYLDYLCDQIREAVELFPEADGIFLDIISQGQCCCKWCLEVMQKNCLDASKEADRKKCAKIAQKNYYQKTTAASQNTHLDMPIFHNGGHIQRGNREVLKYYSHLELESLPTGGWGYDHFPISARYCIKLPHDFLGQTGKFHTTWGEFGGYKHPNALRYECATMLAYGAKCSIGDHLHPSGKMDMSTYKNIGQAYAEVKTNEPWCGNVESVADIGLLSKVAINSVEQNGIHDEAVDTGAGRILLEGHFLFDVLDREMDFSKYKMLILPDEIKINAELKAKLDEYLAGGGKLFLTGQSGLAEDDRGFVFDIGATWQSQSEYQPDYIQPCEELRPSFVNSPLVMYLPGQRIKVTSGESLGDVYDPYFNRTYEHFCGHQHAPPRPEASGFDCGVRNGNIIYLAHPVFKIYRGLGAVAYKEYIINAICSLLSEPTVDVNLPSTGRITLMHQSQHNRYVLHLLYANTISRGAPMELSGGTLADKTSIEIIEELLPLRGIKIQLRMDKPISKITLEPQGEKIEFDADNGTLAVTIDEFTCHQMIVLHYGM